MSMLTEPLKVVYEVVEINATRFEIKEIAIGQLFHVADTKKEADFWCRNLNMVYNDGRNDGYFRAEKDERDRIEKLKMIVANSTHVHLLNDLNKITLKGTHCFTTRDIAGRETTYSYSGGTIKQLTFFKIVG